MANRSVTVEIEYNNIPDVVQALPDWASDKVEETCRQMTDIMRMYASAFTATGFLLENIGYEMTGPGEGAVYSNAWYSGYVEFGTTKRAATPFITPAIEQVSSENINTIFSDGSLVQ